MGWESVIVNSDTKGQIPEFLKLNQIGTPVRLRPAHEFSSGEMPEFFPPPFAIRSYLLILTAPLIQRIAMPLEVTHSPTTPFRSKLGKTSLSNYRRGARSRSTHRGTIRSRCQWREPAGPRKPEARGTVTYETSSVVIEDVVAIGVVALLLAPTGAQPPEFGLSSFSWLAGSDW